MRADGADERVDRADGHWLLVEWFLKARGTFSVDRRRPRSRGADHARATERDPSGAVVGQWIRDADGIDALIRDFVAAGGAAVAASGTASGGTSPVPIESICPRCEVARDNVGRRGFLEQVSLGASLGFDGKRTELDIFACPQCRSVELFLAGPTPKGPASTP